MFHIAQTIMALPDGLQVVDPLPIPGNWSIVIIECKLTFLSLYFSFV